MKLYTITYYSVWDGEDITVVVVAASKKRAISALVRETTIERDEIISCKLVNLKKEQVIHPFK